jgi:hypothetical protein
MHRCCACCVCYVTTRHAHHSAQSHAAAKGTWGCCRAPGQLAAAAATSSSGASAAARHAGGGDSRPSLDVRELFAPLIGALRKVQQQRVELLGLL